MGDNMRDPFRKRTRSEKFLDEQDWKRRQSNDANRAAWNKDRDRRDAEFQQNLRARDEAKQKAWAANQAKVKADIEARDWARKNDEHKKSTFYAELQKARTERRPAIYDSFLDVPDLEKPEPEPAPFSEQFDVLKSKVVKWGIIGFIGLAVIGIASQVLAVVFTYVVKIGFWAVIIAYAGTTAVWLIKRYALKPVTPEAIAAAEAWSPVTLTQRIVRYVSGLAAKIRERRAGRLRADAGWEAGQPNDAQAESPQGAQYAEQQQYPYFPNQDTRYSGQSPYYPHQQEEDERLRRQQQS